MISKILSTIVLGLFVGIAFLPVCFCAVLWFISDWIMGMNYTFIKDRIADMADTFRRIWK